MVLIARTDARATDGIEEAVRRGRLYAEAGVDMIFVEAPHSEEELEFVGNELRPLGLPLMVNLVEGGKTPLVSVNHLGKLGFSFITFSGFAAEDGDQGDAGNADGRCCATAK